MENHNSIANRLVQVRKSNVHGKGVFALTDIPAGTIITCDILCVEKENIPYSSIILPWTYPFDIEHCSICIGFGSYFNGDKVNNNVKIKSLDRVALTKSFEIIREVKSGEELFLDYKNW